MFKELMAAASNSSPDPLEYVFASVSPSPQTGTIADIGNFESIKIAGGGGGGISGTTQTSPVPTIWNGGGAGAGATTNLVGETFPIPGNGITSIYYQVAGKNSGIDTFVQINGPGGTDLIRFNAGNNGSVQTGGAAPTTTGAGPNAVAGTAGRTGGNRQAGEPPGADAATNGAAGGGGGGGLTNDNQPGINGGDGGPSSFPNAPNFITTLGIGPGPGTWSIPGASITGGIGGVGPPPYGGGVQGEDIGTAEAGNTPPGAGEVGLGGGGGAGAGIGWSDPSDPSVDGTRFCGGGGGPGSGSLPIGDTGDGGAGFLIIQLT